jgi:hypothetical protein
MDTPYGGLIYPRVGSRTWGALANKQMAIYYNKPFCEPCFICEATWGVAMQQQQKKAPNNSPTSSGSVKKKYFNLKKNIYLFICSSIYLFIYLFIFLLSFFQICNAAIVLSILRQILTYLATLLWKKTW